MNIKKNNLLIIAITIILLISGFLARAVNKLYIYLPVSAYAILAIYFVIRMLTKNPVKLIRNKLDIFILLLVISTTIPLIFNTYVTLHGTMETILLYIYAFSIYLLLRENSTEGKNINNLIINTLISVTLLLIIVGIDELTTGFFIKNLSKNVMIYYMNANNSLISVFGSPNILGTYIASILILNTSMYLKQEKENTKAIYQTVTTILFIGLILTYSKVTFLVFPFILIAYILAIKSKNDRIAIVQNILISFIIAALFVIVFEKLFYLNNYMSIWIVFGMITVLDYFINMFLIKINMLLKNIKLTKILIAFACVSVLIIIYVIIGLNVYTEYEVFKEGTEATYNVKVIGNIKGNTKYNFEFDILSKLPKDKAYTIKLIERDNKNRIICDNEIHFSEYDGLKNIELVTNEATEEIKITFRSNYSGTDKILTIRKLNVNGEEIPLQYKYLPTELVDRIKNIDYKNERESFVIMRDGLELASQNLFTGIGGFGWRYKLGEIQDYHYTTNFNQNYAIRILIEYGVLGLIAYIGIIVIFIKLSIKFVKEGNTNLIAVVFALAMVLLQSLIDIDMEYAHVLTYIFGMLGILSKNIEGKDVKTSNISNIIMIIVLITSMYLVINSIQYNKYEKIDNLIKQRREIKPGTEDYKNISKEIADGYNNILKYERYNYLDVYTKTLIYYLDADVENMQSILEEYYTKIAEYENKNKTDINSILLKTEKVYDLINHINSKGKTKLQSITEKYIYIIINEYDKTLKEAEKCLEQEYKDISAIQNKLDYIYEDVSKILKNNKHNTI